MLIVSTFFFFQAEDGIRDVAVTGVQTCALPISIQRAAHAFKSAAATIGAHRLAQLLEQMEASARSGDVARAQSALQDVSSEALTVLDHVRVPADGGGHG